MYEGKRVKRFVGFLLLGISLASSAHTATSDSTEQEHVYLVQLINQLNAMLPIVRAAEKAQPKNQRISFHYSVWHDAKGQKQNGLLEDIQEIKRGIEEKLNAISIEPRAVTPIRGDYLGQERKN
jgi:RAQPRD family integrative conjugative element protein